MRSRLALAFAVVVGACLTFSATASACQDVNLWLPDGAGPGDTVPYSISGISHGGTYSFTIAGVPVSGANDSTDPNVNGDSGTFTMPNLGTKELTLTASGTCTCPEDQNPQNIGRSMQYIPAPPATAPAPPTNASTPTATPAPAVQSSTHRSQPRQPQAPAGKHSVSVQRAHSATTSPAVVPTPAALTAGGSPASSSTSRSAGATAEAKESSGVPDHVLHALGSTTSVGPAKVPTLGLLLIGVLLVAGIALAAFVIYLFRNGPDPDAAVKAPAPSGPDPVEEELQQIIADEMARQLVSDLNLGEPTKVSLK